MPDTFMKTVVITKVCKESDDVYSMWAKDKEIVEQAKPGQFISLYCKEGSRLLPRPISICEIDKKNETFRLVYRVLGKGTEEFSAMKVGDSIKVMGPLGNGFTLEGRKAILVGGGIGIPPMLQLAKELTCEKKIVLGFRDELFLNKEFEQYGSVYISTEDGSAGTKGNVIDAIKENAIEGDIIFACGPTPMLKGIQSYGAKNNIEVQLSLEERMACGVGACFGCVCKSKEKDHHSNVNNKRVCKDGPVFYGKEVEL
jgi:dihydroorotate dehydrogenase electron transfer subunit